MILPRWPLTVLMIGALCAAAFTSARAQVNAAPRAAPNDEIFDLYVGGNTRRAGDGLCRLRFDAATGILSDPRLAAPLFNPDWLTIAPDGRTLYAGGATENRSGLSAFGIEGDGKLRPISQQLDAENPTSLAVDASGQWLVGAYYGAGSWSLWPLQADGAMGAVQQTIQHVGSGPDAGRQQSPHAHQAIIAPDNQRVWIVDLGIDKAMIYDFDARTGAIEPAAPASASMHAGSGPRHLAWGANGRFAYVVGEMGNSISVLQGARGVPGTIQTISTLPPNFKGYSAAAEVQISPDGQFLYASNRGFNSLARFAIERDGTLRSLGWTPVGREPRHFSFDPTGRWVLVGNQQNRSIEVFAFDAKSGDLTLRSKFENVLNEPTCLVFRPQFRR